ncbi:putative Integral outer membrane protein TolC, efflux pump component [Novosphingobium nitrogenifigens DSM 19370]|uniref:Putative Integral outer membrane protein TolC, efflux pump component n=1 Tax=Novosphingobium nitrogenifigens DSM 19370 TaxID=983920 RepID=F1ZB18_9SPHN|nr:putative Integral outer membrane protein TolC, efflux pump component [Novosphingobium nitrogenifigens DSM 19370]
MVRLSLLAALACSACTPQRQANGALHLLSAPVHAGDVSAPWWTASGDPVLDHLTAEALGREPAPVCAAPHGTFGQRLVRVFHGERAARVEAAAQAWDKAGARLTQARDIGLAYLRARAWQARLAERMASEAAIRDNGEIAHFRREAGLVPGLDEDMAGIMVGLASSDLDGARAGLDRALAELARLTGKTQADLRTLLETGQGAGIAVVADRAGDVDRDAPIEVGGRPDLHALEMRTLARRDVRHLDAAALQKQIASPTQPWAAQWVQALAGAQDAVRKDRGDLADAQVLHRDREDVVNRADKALANARLAYRNGMAAFSTLYVAEAAGLAAREARVESLRAIGEASVQLWTDEGRGEVPGGAPCD